MVVFIRKGDSLRADMYPSLGRTIGLCMNHRMTTDYTRVSMNIWKNDDRLLYVALGLGLALLWTGVGLGLWNSRNRERTFPQAQIDMLAAQCPNETLQGDAAAVERWLQQEWTFYVLTGQKRFFRPSSFNEFVRDFVDLLHEIETGNPHWADVEGGCVALLEAYLAH